MNKLKSLFAVKAFVLAGILLFTMACQVKKTDLLAWSFDTPLTAIDGLDTQAKTVRDLGFGLAGYALSKPEQYSIGHVALEAGAPAAGNLPPLMVYAGGSNRDTYLGFKYISADAAKTKEIIGALKKSYPKFREHETGGPLAAYSWDLPNGGTLFVYPGQIFEPSGSAGQPVNFMVIRKDTRMANRNDPGMSTISQYFETKFPLKEKR